MTTFEPIHPGEHLAEILGELGVRTPAGEDHRYDAETAGVDGLRMRGVMIGSR